MTDVPVRQDVPLPIRGCICRECGRIAPSWFHGDFLLTPGVGFLCMWCAFPPEHCEKMGYPLPEPPDPALYPDAA